MALKLPATLSLKKMWLKWATSSQEAISATWYKYENVSQIEMITQMNCYTNFQHGKIIAH